MTNPTAEHGFPDGELGRMLLDEVPAPAAHYWHDIDARLAGAHAQPDGAQPAQRVDVSPLQDRHVPTGDSSRRWKQWPVLAAAAALIIVALIVTTQGEVGDRDTVDIGVADGETTDLDALPGPKQNVDHWHAIYGIWDCTLGDGQGEWVAPFQSTKDDVGIHSHGDGLISVHPFVEESAGENATFSHFAEAMNIVVTDDSITLDDGRILDEGTMCGGQSATIEMYRWQDGRRLEAEPATPPRTIITEDFGAERFYNDLEVWVLALTPAGAEVPLPPEERFDTLATWWLPTGQPAHPEAPAEGEQALEIPAHDEFVDVRLVATGPEVDPIAVASTSWMPEDLPDRGELVSGSGTHWMAVAARHRLQVDLVSYTNRDDAVGLEPTMSCQSIVDMVSSCTRDGDALAGATRLRPDSFTNAETPFASVAVWNAPPDARWLVVQTSTGRRIVADVVAGTSWAAWRAEHGTWTSAQVLDLDHNVMWSRGDG